MFLRLKLFKTFVDRDFANFANLVYSFLGDIQVTLLTNEIDDPRRNRVWCVFGNDLLCLHHVGDEQAQHGQFLVDGQLATITIDKGRGFRVV